jgi:hypothetical protein
VGKNVARSLKLRLGDWIHMPDIGWRQINESSSKNDGIEFFATRRDEYKSKHPRIAIDRVVFASPSQQARQSTHDQKKGVKDRGGNNSTRVKENP